MSTPSQESQRLISLDQFRGYTVLGMFLVNYVGSYDATPEILSHHNNYCSYADTIMPHFLFAVGLAFRLTFERRVQREGSAAAYGRVVKRLLGLALVAIVVYGASSPAANWKELVDLGPVAGLARAVKRDWFQTLMHIAATSLWILPVIRCSAGTRIAYAAASGIAHVLLSYWFNFIWCNTDPNAIDGGPLGFLTWSICAIAGTVACDLVQSPSLGRRCLFLGGSGVLLMALGWGLSCGTRFYDVPVDRVEKLKGEKFAENPVLPQGEQLAFRGLAEPPFVPPPDQAHRKWNYWMMSQRAGTLSYLTFSAGLSLVVYLLFHLACDLLQWQWYVFHVFGTNALAGYIIHSTVAAAIKPFVPRDSPGWYVTASFLLFLWIVWVFVRYLERNKMFIRL